MNDPPRLATLEADGWRLQSGEERHVKSPDTFWIPSRARREALGSGDGVKLLFEIDTVDGGGVERMWVIVRRMGDLYLGVLDTRPVDPGRSPLAPGHEVAFGPEHVVDIEAPPRHYVIECYGEDFFDS